VACMGTTMHVMAGPVAATAPLPALRLALVALACAGLGAGLAFLALVLDSDHTDDRGVVAAVGLLVGWSFIATGLFAWWRRPGNRTGVLMVAVGFAWFATGVSASNEDLVFTAGIALDAPPPSQARLIRSPANSRAIASSARDCRGSRRSVSGWRPNDLTSGGHPQRQHTTPHDWSRDKLKASVWVDPSATLA
jgi:hypothetical protein